MISEASGGRDQQNIGTHRQVDDNERSDSSPRHGWRNRRCRAVARYYPTAIGLGFGLQGTNHVGVIYDGSGSDYRGAADRGAIDLEYYVDGDQCRCRHACRLGTFAVYFRDLTWG